MPFHFPLQAVLHFREGMQHQQELRLRAANQQVARLRHLVTQLDASMGESRALQMRQLEAGTFAVELRFQLSCQALVQQHKSRLEEELARLEKLRDRQREIYQHARQQFETLQGLRDQQLQMYKKNAARSEQRQLDDLFLLRREYLRRR
jgi:flagellar export protein FliJ